MEEWQQGGIASYAPGTVLLASDFLPQRQLQVLPHLHQQQSPYIVILNSGAWCTALGANIYIKAHSVNSMQSFCTATAKVCGLVLSGSV